MYQKTLLFQLLRIFLLIGLGLLTFTQAHAASGLKFASPEHAYAGDHVRLKFGPQKLMGSQFSDTIHPGYQLSYGDLVTLPDFFGDPDHTISQGATPKERQQRFSHLIALMHTDSDFGAVWHIIKSEENVVENALKHHENVTTALQKIALKDNIKYAIATHLKYIHLLIHDFDHFGADADKAYAAGHTVAVASAIHGYNITHQQGDHDAIAFHAIQQCRNKGSTHYNTCIQQTATNYLRQAYAENAIANHYLTDRFAGGHIRTPFRQVYQSVLINKVSAAIADNLMHDEDNKNGVIVKNSAGKEWVAYGDDYYFSPQNKDNRQHMQKTMQTSADEIYQAFTIGKDTDPGSRKVIAMLPLALPPKTVFKGHTQTEPLFLIEHINGKDYVYRRQSVCNPENFSAPTYLWTALGTVATYELHCKSSTPSVQTLLLNKFKKQIST